MKKIIIFGNSGSGKSTMAKRLSGEYSLAHLDLDTLAWQKDVSPPTRLDIGVSENIIKEFILTNESWVIEGCYGDLIELAIPFCDKLIFLNPSTSHCVENAMKRPWEPHKYNSKKEQDDNLKFLIDWIREYSSRSDDLSLSAHQKIFNEFSGDKEMIGGIKINKFQDQDAPHLHTLFNETIRSINSSDYNREQINAWASKEITEAQWLKSFEEKYTFAAKEIHSYVGFCELRRDGYIDRFYISKYRIGQGIGTLLYDKLEQHALSIGLKNLTVESSITALEFFKRRGFTIIQEQEIERRGVTFKNYFMEKSLA